MNCKSKLGFRLWCRRVFALLWCVLVLALFSLIPNVLLLVILATLMDVATDLLDLDGDLSWSQIDTVLRKLANTIGENTESIGGKYVEVLTFIVAMILLVLPSIRTHGSSGIERSEILSERCWRKNHWEFHSKPGYRLLRFIYSRNIITLIISAMIIISFDPIRKLLACLTKVTLVIEMMSVGDIGVQIGNLYGTPLWRAVTGMSALCGGYFVNQNIDHYKKDSRRKLRHAKALLVRPFFMRRSAWKFPKSGWWSLWKSSCIRLIQCGLFWCRFLIVLFLIWSFQASLSKEATPPSTSDPREPILGLKVLFGTAQFDDRSFENPKFSKGSSGIKLDPGSKSQLREFLKLLNTRSDLGPCMKLVVVGYASDTRVTVLGQESDDLNVSVANLRAEVVTDFLKTMQISLKQDPDNPSLSNLTICRRVWEDYTSLRNGRPYQAPANPTEHPADVPLERMNQSVMLCVINEKETNHNCNGGEASRELCFDL